MTYFAETDFRSQRRTFGIKQADRRQHCYIIGKSGTGKTTLLRNLIISDIRNGHGVAVIDPHGDLVESVLACIPSHRTDDVAYFNPADQAFPIGFNILESVAPTLQPLVASHVISVFKNIWQDSWGPRLEYILYNAVAALLEAEGSTLLGIPYLLANKVYRDRVVSQVRDPIIKSFWVQEYARYSPDFQREAIAPIQNKVGQFLTSAPIRNILGQVKSSIEMRFIMDNQRLLLANLAKGAIGEDKTSLLGSLLVTKIFLAALQRVHQPEEERQDFHLYIDECHNLATPIFASMLSEARKYRLNLVLAHQYLDQLPREIKQGVMGNVGTLIVFRCGAPDAAELEQEFAPEFRAADLEHLDRHQICLKLAVDGKTSRPFSACTLSPTTPQRNEQNRENILKTSRQKYGMKRELIEGKIHRWLASLERLQASP